MRPSEHLHVVTHLSAPVVRGARDGRETLGRREPHRRREQVLLRDDTPFRRVRLEGGGLEERRQLRDGSG